MDIKFVNPGDWQAHTWKHNYLVTVTAQGMQFFVNADCEQDALDELIDFFEAMGWAGLVSDGSDLSEEEREEYVCGGNHGLYLTAHHIHIEEV
jgi:hypothetical protein